MNTQTIVVAQSPAHVVVAPSPGPVLTDAKKRAFLGIGITELVLGGLLFLIGAIAISPSVGGILYGYGASGLWSGIWAIIAGSLAIATYKSPTSCIVTGGLVVSILACLAGFAAGCYEASWASVFSAFHAQGYGSYLTPSALPVHAILALLAFGEFIVAIVHSAYCCSTGCCGSQTQGAVVTNAYSTNVPVQAVNQPPQYSAQQGYNGPQMEQKLGV